MDSQGFARRRPSGLRKAANILIPPIKDELYGQFEEFPARQEILKSLRTPGERAWTYLFGEPRDMKSRLADARRDYDNQRHKRALNLAERLNPIQEIRRHLGVALEEAPLYRVRRKG